MEADKSQQRLEWIITTDTPGRLPDKGDTAGVRIILNKKGFAKSVSVWGGTPPNDVGAACTAGSFLKGKFQDSILASHGRKTLDEIVAAVKSRQAPSRTAKKKTTSASKRSEEHTLSLRITADPDRMIAWAKETFKKYNPNADLDAETVLSEDGEMLYSQPWSVTREFRIGAADCGLFVSLMLRGFDDSYYSGSNSDLTIESRGLPDGRSFRVEYAGRGMSLTLSLAAFSPRERLDVFEDWSLAVTGGEFARNQILEIFQKLPCYPLDWNMKYAPLKYSPALERSVDADTAARTVRELKGIAASDRLSIFVQALVLGCSGSYREAVNTIDRLRPRDVKNHYPAAAVLREKWDSLAAKR